MPTIGRIARQSGVNVDTIRYCEREGLLREAPRTVAGYRVFTPDTILRVRFIKRAQNLGFSLREIVELLTLRMNGLSSCRDMQQRTTAKIADIARKIKTLRAMKRVLTRLTAHCPGRAPVYDCPVLEHLGHLG